MKKTDLVILNNVCACFSCLILSDCSGIHLMKVTAHFAPILESSSHMLASLYNSCYNIITRSGSQPCLLTAGGD